MLLFPINNGPHHPSTRLTHRVVLVAVVLLHLVPFNSIDNLLRSLDRNVGALGGLQELARSGTGLFGAQVFASNSMLIEAEWRGMVDRGR